MEQWNSPYQRLRPEQQKAMIDLRALIRHRAYDAMEKFTIEHPELELSIHIELKATECKEAKS